MNKVYHAPLSNNIIRRYIMANLFDTKDRTAEFAAEDISQNRVMGIFAYIGILVLIPIFAAKGSKWARFHANNGILLAIAEVAIGVTFGILSCIPYVGWLFGLLGWLCSLVPTALAVFGIVNAARGKAKELPVIGGKITILK